MPYEKNTKLPPQVRKPLPEHAQTIYRKAYNNALNQYSDPEDRRGDDSLEEVAAKFAWDAVKQKYEKIDGQWVSKDR